ncbi:restriction endonuclease subunit S [Terasakiella pusilla]|uniref:restriction endonuclease subunit S n=1 Tax=Terasakiella pusilla TaxID=64973 RepID=UPI003AA89CC6
MNGWKEAKLSDVAVIERKSIAPENIPIDSVLLGLEHLDGQGNIEVSKLVKGTEIRSAKFKFSDQHILYGKLRPYLRKIAMPRFAGVCSTDILPIRPDTSVIHKGYLYRYLRQQEMVDLATTRSSGANLPRISPKILEDFPICFPPIEEQRRIAAILDKADAIRQKRKSALTLADTFLRATFLDMFGDPVTNPMGWDTFEFSKAVRHSNNGLSRRRKTEENVGNIVLRIQDIQKDCIKTNAPNRIQLDEAEKKRFILDQHDLLFIRVNGNRDYVGRCAVFDGSSESVAHNDHIIRFKLNGLIDPYYASFLFNLKAGKELLSSVVKTSAGQYTVSQDGIKTLKVPVPPIEKQKEFCCFINEFKQVKKQFNIASNLDQDLFASLSQRAFKGEL